MNRVLVARQRDVLRRWLVHVEPVRMRVVKTKEFEMPLAKLIHQATEVLGCNQIIPDRIGRDVFRRKRSRDYIVLPRQNPATFPVRLKPGMLQDLPKHFPATLDDRVHVGIVSTSRATPTFG